MNMIRKHELHYVSDYLVIISDQIVIWNDPSSSDGVGWPIIFGLVVRMTGSSNPCVLELDID